MPACAPRIPWEIVEAIPRLDNPRRPIAETWRRIGALADGLGVTRPSYEQTRRLVHRARDLLGLASRVGPLADLRSRAASPIQVVDAMIERSADYDAAHEAILAERRWRPRAGPPAARRVRGRYRRRRR